MQQPEEKKSFWIVYTAVAVFYVAMIITYALVVHHAAEDGANNVPCNPKADKNCILPDSVESVELPSKDFPSMATQLFTLV